jgi:NAD(P)-dependent dehydrogenase (short-subunit alcohol dehydrogenase family)
MSPPGHADRFAGKVAIVTGGGGRIGAATAQLLAAEGAAVTVADLDGDTAAAVVAEIDAAGGTARAQATDVADPGAVEAMVRDTVAAFGGLDVLHNNAAAINLSLEDQDVVTGAIETWRTVLDVNLMGPMLGCRFAIPAMLERGGGVIVNTASAAAFYGSKSLAAYGTSKAGLVALTRYVATAYADRNIRCNAVAPGVVIDQATQDALGGPMGDTLRSYTRSHLVGRLGYPEEIAAAVAYLASDDAAFVTGETLRVDGGMTAHSPSYGAD